MRAVSLRQPWAWLATHGHLHLINMDWDTSYRGEFIVRAGTKLVQRDYLSLAAQLHAQLHIEVPAFDDVDQVPRGGIVGVAQLVDVTTDNPSPVARGPYIWLTSNARPLPFVPFNPPYAGSDLRWFDVPRTLAGLDTPSIERFAA